MTVYLLCACPGRRAITSNDPDFHGEGNPDTGEDYAAGPGERAGSGWAGLAGGRRPHSFSAQGWHGGHHVTGGARVRVRVRVGQDGMALNLASPTCRSWSSHTALLNQILLCSPHRLAHALCADLDHMNPDLRDSLVDWLNYLHDYVGFQGWRFDFVRGYAAKYTAE